MRFITETITPKLAIAASIDGITPGRRSTSERGAAPVGAGVGPAAAAAIFSPITFGSGRTMSAIPSATSDSPAATSHGTVSVSAATSLSAKSGPQTTGPSTAPNTEPKRTSEMPRARRSGGYMSPAAVRMSSVTAPDTPISTKPGITRSVELQCVPPAVSRQPIEPRMKPTAITGTRPKRSIARPAGRAESADAVR